MQAEFFDVFDKNRIFQNRTIERGALSSPSDFRLIVHVWLRANNRFLITKRADGIFWGGFWQPTGGHARAGETSYEAAARELSEETGIQADFDNAYFLFDYSCVPSEKTADEKEKLSRHSFFLDAWMFDISKSVEKIGEKRFLQNLNLQKEEVGDARFVDFDEILELWKNNQFMRFEQTFAPYFDELRTKLFKTEKAVSICDLRKKSIDALKNCQKTDSAELDSRLLLAKSLRKNVEFLFQNPKVCLSDAELKSFDALIERRKTGENLAYILGEKSFWKHNFLVSHDVLVPKPDTEILVEQVILRLKAMSDSRDIKIADVCAGSGCVIISVLSELQLAFQSGGLPKIAAFATDISQNALEIAKKNAEKIIPKVKLNFRQGDLCDALKDERDFDIIFANPPYVPAEIAKRLLDDGRGEPLLALDGGNDGTDLIFRLICQAKSKLRRGGWILLETGEYNAEKTRNFLFENNFSEITTANDLSEMPRVTMAKFN